MEFVDDFELLYKSVYVDELCMYIHIPIMYVRIWSYPVIGDEGGIYIGIVRFNDKCIRWIWDDSYALDINIKD